ncbi:DUF3231 family protein [Paraliobacillus sp. X-1268]|uniref:DUF3231 family protein n=1 Tax=Paraliobacillus sp. X-1268 TaxID=2213193 RepID=UPI000E3E0E2A|nr:DUF3231 family protein [Paraliobacillus sp. X-1268]
MDKVNHNVQLTSAEIANLWTQYMNDTMSICILTHSIEKVQDKDIKDLLEFSISIAKSHIKKINKFLIEENYPIPKGFTKEDVDLNAPPLFTDTFMLVYMHVMTLHGLTGYAGALGTSARADQISYFIQCNKDTTELYERIVKLMLSKGIYSKPAHISTPNQIDFVNNQRYLTGWFGKKRPLNAMEISGLSYNMQKTVVKIVLEIGFEQVCTSKEVKKYMNKGKKICKSQFTKMRSLLSKEDLSSSQSWVSEITDSTVSPFSEKLMLFHIVTLVSAAVGFYGAGLAVTQRRDLALKYTNLIAEIGLYAEDGAELLIKYGWMEQPPLADDRENLANK